ncbi:diguanylate cyclase domain-containing protein [Marinomonas aquimarina]|uniref:GGDEF domain-containing protein n=1 Tax=Marinomonas aquimarina TaxID=295068 RepID=UPI0039E00073
MAAFYCYYNSVLRFFPPLLIVDAMAVVLGLSSVFALLGLKRPQLSRYILLMLVVLVCFSAMLIKGNQGYNLAWAFICPPLSIFLLGYRRGAVISGLYLAMVVGLMVAQGDSWQATQWHGGALANIIMIYLGLFAFACHYEASRRSSHEHLREANAKLALLAIQDDLTGLYNRRYIEDLLLNSEQESIFVAMVDIDDFKSINDRYGHPVGDEVLKQTAHILQDVVAEEGIVGRWGGEEFIIVHYADQPSVFVNLLEALVQQVRQRSNQYGPSVTISVGGSTYYKQFHKASLHHVDHALYDAKESGKNDYRIVRHAYHGDLLL